MTVNKTVVTLDDTQTMTGKTLMSPAISSPTGLVKGDVGLGNVDNTSDATKNSATAALTNKDLTAGTNTFPTLNQNTTGSAAKLTTARNINGGAFDGSADILIPPAGLLAPSDYGWISWAGDIIFFTGAATALTAGQTYMTLLPIRSATTITNVLLSMGVAGSGLTSGQNFAGLFNSSGTLLSATADQSTAWAGTAGVLAMALTTPQSVAAGLYYVGWFFNGTTSPRFRHNASVNAALGGGSLATTPRAVVDATHTGLTTSFPSPVTKTANSTQFWAAVS